MKRAKYGENKAYVPKHTSSSEKQAGDNFMPWACMVASGIGSLIYTVCFE